MKNDRRIRKWRALQQKLNKRAPQNDTVRWRDQIEASYMSKVKCNWQEVGVPEETDLDENVWSEGLPEDVFCTILACLPLSSFSRLRCVCKKWNLMAQDRIFLNTCARIQCREASLFLKTKDGYWTFEPALNAWKCIPSEFFYPKNFRGTCSLVTAAGGRVLFIMSTPPYSLMVVNPLNNSQRTLPPMFDMSEVSELPSASEIHVVGMYVDDTKKFYNILVVDKRTNKVGDDSSDDSDDELEPITSQIYDSRTSQWDMAGSFEPTHELRILNAALFAETLHCLTIAPQLSHVFWNSSVVDELAVFKVLPDAWEDEAMRVPTQDQALVAPHIFSSRGRQMLVAAVPVKKTRSDFFPVWKSIIIWELEMIKEVEDKWVKMVEIDLQSVKNVRFKVALETFVFLSDGDFLYFGSNTGSSLGVINIHRKTWRILPSFPGFSQSSGYAPSAKRYQMFLYEPRFDLVA